MKWNVNSKSYEAFRTSPISQDLLATQKENDIAKPIRQPKWEIQMLIMNLTNATNHRKIENQAGNNLDKSSTLLTCSVTHSVSKMIHLTWLNHCNNLLSCLANLFALNLQGANTERNVKNNFLWVIGGVETGKYSFLYGSFSQYLI